MFRKRHDRIRGISGSLEGRTVLVADGSVGGGPGVVRVAAAAGAATMLVAPDNVSVDLQLRGLANTAGEVTGVISSAADQDAQAGLLAQGADLPAGIVVNPTHFSLKTDNAGSAGITPQSALALARLAAAAMRDRGRTGSIVFLVEIDREGPDASASAYLRSEMRRLAAEVASNGIRVNAVATGQIEVNRKGNVVSSRIAPLGHSSLHPVEIGKAAWFLINEDLSAGVTGTTLVVDRGASLPLPSW